MTLPDASPQTPYDWAALIGGTIALLTALGHGVKWILGRADRRETRQQAREDAYVKKIEERLDKVEQTLGNVWTCFGLVASALHAKDPANPALARAAEILGDAFPIDLHTPPDMLDALDRMQ